MKRLGIFLLLLSFILACTGCDAFVRKFTRKKKKTETTEELVLAPEAYPENLLTPAELYREHFLFFKSWQDELAAGFSAEPNHKRQVRCAEEAIKNLQALKGLLKDDKAKDLDTLIKEMYSLKERISQDTYSMKAAILKNAAESLGRKIFRGFGFEKIKDCLK